MHRPVRRVLAAVAVVALAAPPAHAFPASFRWGTAIAGFQAEMGGDPAHDDANTDWWVWAHDGDNIANDRVSGDLPEAGPAFYDRFRLDVRRARGGLRNNAFRLSIEWSRIFPTSTASVDASGGITFAVLQQLDAMADQTEVEHYRKVLRAVRRAHGAGTAGRLTPSAWPWSWPRQPPPPRRTRSRAASAR